jgi:predicted AlkP superfamily phosphohydrolase/phosphomutase
MSKVFVFGIDGASPKLVFNWLDDLPNIKRLVKNGVYGKMETVKPAISIVAWTSFFSGRHPGETGIYNYIARYHKDKTDVRLINSDSIKTKLIWDILGKNNKKSIIINNLFANPVKKINGIILSGLLTPKFNEDALYPYDLKKEILDICGGEYMFDIAESFTYRKVDIDEMIERAYKTSGLQFALVKNFVKTKEWDFFAYTELMSDRLHHRLWRYIDKNHANYENHPKYSSIVKDYYKYLDKNFGEIMSLCPDDTNFIIASDHGMNHLDGRINLNDWLMEKGYLVFNDEYLETVKSRGPIKFSAKEINWKKTKAFATSAYEALVFINKEVVGDYDVFCDKLAKEIAAIPGKDGRKLNTQVFKTKDIYGQKSDENTPDMIVYFDNLHWGTNCDIGNKGLHSLSNLVGSDDALHGREGIFIMAGEKIAARGEINDISILDATPTILNLFDLKKENDMDGKIIGLT